MSTGFVSKKHMHGIEEEDDKRTLLRFIYDRDVKKHHLLSLCFLLLFLEEKKKGGFCRVSHVLLFALILLFSGIANVIINDVGHQPFLGLGAYAWPSCFVWHGTLVDCCFLFSQFSWLNFGLLCVSCWVQNHIYIVSTKLAWQNSWVQNHIYVVASPST